MIGQLRGILIEKQPPTLMMDVNGVGYVLQAPMSTFFALPELGKEITLRTHFVVREEAQLLYGFATRDEWSLFQEIIKINGVGPKIALALLSGMSPPEFAQVLQMQSVDRLQRIPGVGAKTAQRILVEMQGRKNLEFKQVAIGMRQEKQEAIMALMALGYKSSEATQAVSKIENTDLNCEHIIKEALQGLAKR